MWRWLKGSRFWPNLLNGLQLKKEKERKKTARYRIYFFKRVFLTVSTDLKMWILPLPRLIASALKVPRSFRPYQGYFQYHSPRKKKKKKVL